MRVLTAMQFDTVLAGVESHSAPIPPLSAVLADPRFRIFFEERIAVLAHRQDEPKRFCGCRERCQLLRGDAVRSEIEIVAVVFHENFGPAYQRKLRSFQACIAQRRSIVKSGAVDEVRCRRR